ncbi:DUF6415 family natural product biosynthesis protein [Streptomyces sp. NPDC001093]|uniref:DUF6415 family natural product biosynthesis protein n=1 Tax=Streptomyces sp. NPDC001093 TaxID=3154376 RepID=UPI003326DA8A
MTRSTSTKVREVVSAAAGEPPEDPGRNRVATKGEESLAIEHWLLAAAASDADQARTAWETEGLALLRCGAAFHAIRMPLNLVENAAGCTVPAEVDAYLADALLGALVIRCGHERWLYILCEPSTVKEWKALGIECLRDGRPLSVPRPDVIGHSSSTASYWAVRMFAPGLLGNGNAVSQLVSYGRYRMASTVLNPEHTSGDATCVDLNLARTVRDEILHLTRDLPNRVPQPAQLEPAVAELRDYLEYLVRCVEVAIEEEGSANRQSVQWLLGRLRRHFSSGAPPTDREPAVRAEEMALFCRTLRGVYERHRGHGERGSGD